jgi:hypothetical protein
MQGYKLSHQSKCVTARLRMETIIKQKEHQMVSFGDLADSAPEEI